MSALIKLLVKSESAPVAICHKDFAPDAPLEVRDLSTRATLLIRACDVSCYLHTLFLDGRVYQILNVIKES